MTLTDAAKSGAWGEKTKTHLATASALPAGQRVFVAPDVPAIVQLSAPQ